MVEAFSAKCQIPPGPVGPKDVQVVVPGAATDTATNAYFHFDPDGVWPFPSIDGIRDATPDRLSRAKFALGRLFDLIEERGGHRVGLIAFAGRAAILCPLTPDFSFFRLVLDEVSANMVGRGGTRWS